MLMSSDDEEEEEVEKTAESAPGVTGEDPIEGEAGPVEKSKKKRSNDSMELVEYSPDELRSVDKELLNAEITQLEGELPRLPTIQWCSSLCGSADVPEDIGKAKPNLNVLTEYRRREAEFLDRAKDMESVSSQRDNAKKRYDDLRKVRLDEFMAGFSAISSKLKEMYQMITMGGNAEIELIDSMDPFSEGKPHQTCPRAKNIELMNRCCLVHHASQEVLASYCKSVGRRKDAGFVGIGVCASCLQANPALLHGRD
jgi:structural maintenance of chromosome 4